MRHRPVIETIINTVALALTSWAVLEITTTDGVCYHGYVALFVAMGLEYFKYFGRQKNLW